MIILDESTNLAEASRLMRNEHTSSIIVGHDSQHVVGIITEQAILYYVVTETGGPFKTSLKETMNSPLVKADEATSVKDVIAVMRRNGIRRVRRL